MTKLRWFIPIVFLLPLRAHAFHQTVGARVATVAITPGEVTPLHLRPEFESTIRMPEEVTSVALGSLGAFKAEHNEAEPNYVYVKPITRRPAQSNLFIATRSGQHVTLELISDGTANGVTQAVDFLVEYRSSRRFLVSAGDLEPTPPKPPEKTPRPGIVDDNTSSRSAPLSTLEVEFAQQERINAPAWKKWDGKQVETALGDIRQWNNRTIVSYSVLNSSDQAVEIVPPQIQITGRKTEKKKKKEGKGIISDQLEIRDFKLSATRLVRGRELMESWSSTDLTSNNPGRSCFSRLHRRIRSISPS